MTFFKIKSYNHVIFLSWSLWDHVSFEMVFHRDTMTRDDRTDSLKWCESVRMHICVYKCYAPNVFPDSGDKKRQSGQTTRSFKGRLTVLGLVNDSLNSITQLFSYYRQRCRYW